MASGGRLFASLPPRPPTPPKDLTGNLTGNGTPSTVHTGGGGGGEASPSASAAVMETPETPSCPLPKYVSASKSPGRGTKRKRVNFILTPTRRDSDHYPSSSSPPSLPRISPNNLNTKRIPLNPRHPNASSKPKKSILKNPRHGLLSDVSLDSDDNPKSDHNSPPSFEIDRMKKMLAAIEQLSASDKSLRLEAYQNLWEVIRDSPDILGAQGFKQNLSRLVESIIRDLRCAKGDDHRDGQIAIEAIKVASTLAWKEVLPETALVSLLEWCTATLGDHAASKALINNVLSLVYQIKPVEVFTTGRVTKIMELLKDLDVRLQGKQVQAFRLDIYRKFIIQKQPCMRTLSIIWLRHLLDALLKQKRDLVKHAVNLGREASSKLGATKEISLGLRAVFNEQIVRQQRSSSTEGSGDGQTVEHEPYGNVVVCVMNRFLSDKLNAERVPQIWSICVSLLRHKSASFRRWEYWGHWLVLLQKCFNSPDLNLKALAYGSWRDLIWASRNDIEKDPELRKILLRPILTKLERVEKDKSTTQAELTFCALVYYSLQPGVSQSVMSLIWDDVITPALVLREDQPNNGDFAMRVFSSILGSTERKYWDQDRLYSSEELDCDALIRLEPNWIRCNADLVLKALDRHYRVSENPTFDLVNSELHKKTWTHLVASITEVGRREVCASNHAIKATASLLAFTFKRIDWTECDERSFLLAISLTDTLIEFAEHLPMVQKYFVQNASDVYCIVANQTGRDLVDDEDSVRSGLDVLLRFMAPSCNCEFAKASCAQSFEKLIDLKLRTAPSVTSKLSELASASELCFCDKSGCYDESNSPHFSDCRKDSLWNQVAAHSRVLLQNRMNSQSDLQLEGNIAPTVERILRNGMLHGATSLPLWLEVLNEAAGWVSQVASQIGLVCSLVVPLLQDIMDIWVNLPSTEIEHMVADRLGALLCLVQELPTNEEGDSLEVFFGLLAKMLKSPNEKVVTYAVQAWDRLRTGISSERVPSELEVNYELSKRREELTTFETSEDNTGAPIKMTDDFDEFEGQESGDQTLPSLEHTSDDTDDQLIDEKDEPEPRQAVHEEEGLQGDRIADLQFQEADDNLGDEISSSPPDFTLPKIFRGIPQSPSKNAARENSPLPDLLLSEEIERVDSSPTPARRRSFVQTDAPAVSFTASSASQPGKKRRSHADSSDVVAPSAISSSPQLVNRRAKVRANHGLKTKEKASSRKGGAKAKAKQVVKIPISLVEDESDMEDCIFVGSFTTNPANRSSRQASTKPMTPRRDSSTNEKPTTPTPQISRKRKEFADAEPETTRSDEGRGQSERKRQKLSTPLGGRLHTPRRGGGNAPDTPGSVLSTAAREILARLRGVLGDVQKAVFGRNESRQIRRTLNELSSATIDAEERGERGQR